MRYTAKTGALVETNASCLVIPRAQAGEIGDALGARQAVERALAATKGKPGAVARVLLDGRPSRLLVVGGEVPGPARKGRKEKRGEPAGAGAERAFHKDVKAAAKALAAEDCADATWAVDGFDAGGRDAYWKARTALAAVSAATYRFTRFKSKKVSRPKLRRVAVHSTNRSGARLAARHATALDAGLALAKDLGNGPPNVCDPAFIAAAGRDLAQRDVTVEVIDEARMAKLGMGAFLSVTQGTRRPAKLVVVYYQGAAADQAPIVLVGKGITFDTGGTNLKPNAGMGEMKFDMCGAAAVLGAAKAAIAARLPVNVVAMAAAAENMPGGAASRPSDIVTTMSGKTVEILNTDAEGRLVLCDALTYAERFKPRAVVDVATLTGAQVVALGSPASALYANDDALADALLAAGRAAHDRFWRMPLWEDYQEQLKSEFADMKNIGGRSAGSITAACFLSRFANYPWAHLDIAGAAFAGSDNKRATGRPTAALFQYLLDAAAGQGQ